MPRSIRNTEGWTLRKLMTNTYTHMKNRYEYMERDVLKTIIVKKIAVYDGKNLGQARTKFLITTSSYPQYKPYYFEKSLWSHSRKKQRTYKHQYQVTIQMDTLSLDDDRIHLRTGSDAKFDFTPKGRGKWVGTGRQKKYIEGTNIQRGIMPDFWLRLSWLYQQNGILFGRNYANGPPLKVNPKMIVFLDKHMLRVLEILINRGILQ